MQRANRLSARPAGCWTTCWPLSASLTAFLNGVGGRVDNHGLNVITGFAYSAPYEDLTLRKK